MKVSKYMTTKLVTTQPDASVKDAFLVMQSQRVRHLPVVDGSELVGIISDRDLRRPRWADMMDDWTSYYQINDETEVRDVMTKNPEVAYTYESIGKAVATLRERRYGALPVLNKHKELAGILSAHDLLGALEDCLATTGRRVAS
jgi:acetoin utilization protein AcuB